ncbi:hypothetical protein BJX96DRAFT_173140 [Aspergillus floccosus]
MGFPSQPQIQRFEAGANAHLVWEAVEQDGVAIISNVVPLAVIERLKEEIKPRVETWDNPALNDYKFSPREKFVNGLVAASHAYRHDVLNNSVMHQLCEAAFQQTGDYWLVSAALRLTQPGHPAQVWHRDANGWPLVKNQRPDAPIVTLTVIIPTTAFTEANGATRVILGSHRWPAVDVPSDALHAVAEMNAGDMLVLRQGVVHSGGTHTFEEAETRGMLLLSVASCQLSQFESALGLPRSLVESLTPRVQKLVGWRTVFPLGHQMGLNTIRSGLVEEKLGLKANQPLPDETKT